MSEAVVEEKKKGGKGLVIGLIVLVVLLLIGMGAMAFLLLSGDKSKAEDGETPEAHADAEHGEGESAEDKGHAKTYSPKYKQFPPPDPAAPPGYFVMEKFVVNFNGDGQAKFLAVDLQFMSYYQEIVSATGEMEHLRPMLKNDIERLLRNQHFNALSNADGPDKLRTEILDVTRKVLEKHNIYPDLLEDVYMTRFVMQ
ncbi:flagellar basal body-associated FliL family protein [Thiomicrorhabdus aquaedulcis]|uniref:flagellar basal body-associated FliL family protein n=1 Tax=Thiomicrorhabdus aquaedulcis TaxID=2211106 RepID=UPI000FDB783B|nr:flagellar basal body-associated FliL family protein [Thiomicrorhabdus aquaedulcis]